MNKTVTYIVVVFNTSLKLSAMTRPCVLVMICQLVNNPAHSIIATSCVRTLRINYMQVPPMPSQRSHSRSKFDR